MTEKNQVPDYKETLNLPTTAFPMKAALAQNETKWLKFWQELNIYQQMLAQRQAAPKFVVADGPPYANGEIHIGHALNKILKDMVVKAKYLDGYQTPYIPGWDCHGLPIEHKVEKKIGKPGHKVDAKTFRQKCREYAQSQILGQRQSFMRLGVFGDWDNYYSTMDYRFEANIIRTLGKVIAHGHLHREDRPVHWCIDCGSALAEAELEYIDKQSSAIDVAFTVADPLAVQNIFANNNKNSATAISIVIWTTTPWTLPANQAVTLHAELNYVLLEYIEQKFIVAEALLTSFLQRLTSETGDLVEAKILGKCLGQALAGQELLHPFMDRQVPIILGDHVTTDTGTGCVHTAPAHGYEDYVISKKYGITLENTVAANGCFLPNIAYVGGKSVIEANKIIIEVLQQKQKLLKHVTIQHSYPHCWRHKTPLIFRATPQWFISMDQQGLRPKALQAIKTVKWVPEWGQARIEAMINNRPDWCISRQRTWGVPIPVFLHKESGKLHPDTLDILEKIAVQVEQKGMDAWYEIHSAELLGDEHEVYLKSTDTLDVWFDSGSYHACVAEVRQELSDPVDLYLEGSDQHRGWFQSSLLSSIATKERAPYKAVLTHGFTIDANRQKMSKSLGNVLAPEQVVNTLGADVLRLWVASTDYRGDLHVSEEILKRTSEAYRRIRNTARFLLANLHDFDPVTDLIVADKLLKLDQWLLSRVHTLQVEILAAYTTFSFHLVYQKIHNFCVEELGSFYLDIIKDRQYTGKKSGIPRRSAQTVMYYAIGALVRWIAPILSFTAEEIWQHLPGIRVKSVFLTTWAENIPDLQMDKEMDHAFWQQILAVKVAVNKELEDLRAVGVIGSALEAAVDLYCEDKLYQTLQKLGDELRFVLITSKANIYLARDNINLGKVTSLSELKLQISKVEHLKCVRCWHRVAEVNSIVEFPEVCPRCVANLTTGEERYYA